MRSYKSLIKLFLFVVIIGVGAFGWLASSLPWTSGSMTVAGLAKPVEILRDEHGVPHIAAETEADAYFALGLAHAKDRFWQMEMMRRLGAGRLAEVLGPEVVGADRWARTLGLYALAEKMVADTAPPVRAALEAYARGVNHWLKADFGLLALEFALIRFEPEPWKPADSLVWGKIMASRLGGNWRGEALRAELAKTLSPQQVRELWPSYPDDGPITIVDAASRVVAGLANLAPWPANWPKGASNAWAVAEGETDTGGAILANDPHLAFSAPIMWYLARVETPKWRAMGATVPGVPFFILAQTGTHAWGMTSTQSDIEDLFIEKLSPDEPDRYLTPGGSERFRVRGETIKVKGGDDVKLTVRSTRHGPIISDLRPRSMELVGDGFVVALSATYLKKGDRTADAFYNLVRAENWNTFKSALRLFRGPQQNFFFADANGKIGFIAAGWVPIRGRGKGFMPTAGWTGETDWRDVVALDALPQRAGKDVRRLVNANNPVTGSAYPYFLGFEWAPPYRAARIRALLNEGKGRNVRDAAIMQRDLFSGMARDLLPLMLRAKPNSTAGQRAIVLLRNWDSVMAPERAEPMIFNAWLVALNRALYGDELGAQLGDYLGGRPMTVKSILTQRHAWCDNVKTDRAETCEKILAQSLDIAVAALIERHGAKLDDWRWDQAHVAHFPHPVLTHVPVFREIANLSVPTGGGNATLNRGAMRLGAERNHFRHVHGPGYRAIYNLKNSRGSRFMIATGQSGNPLSLNYRNFLEPWAAGQYIPLGIPLATLREQAASTQYLIPAEAEK
mgnify:CR=1 FL=1